MQVVNKVADDVKDEIESAIYQAAVTILAGNGFSFGVPSRAKGNQLYVPELDRIVLKDSMSQRPFASSATCRKAVITARILGLVHELCLKGIHVTKRDLFYTDVKLFEAGVHRVSPLCSIAGGLDDTLLLPPATCACLCSCMLITTTSDQIACRTKAAQMAHWTMWPACWAVPGPACTVRSCPLCQCHPQCRLHMLALAASPTHLRACLVVVLLHSQRCRLIQLMRLCLHAVVASEKGVVVGRLQFEEDGDPIDCQRMGIGGKAIPSNTDKASRS